ncbi:maintenance of telomere capping protein 1 [Geopyxis carbonaria]|nr:maintenance of telomere capping protein 1 [Geopyxis carbonaria]
MSQKNPDDLLNELEALADPAPAKKTAPRTKASAKKAQADDYDVLAELESLVERPKPSISRPGTPRSASAAPKRSLERARTPAGSGYGIPITRRDSGDVKKAVTPTPAAASAPAPVEAEKKAEPAASPPAQEESAGGWGWGSIWSTASAAVKTAEAVVKEVQQSEEGKKWVTQVKGNADVLGRLAGDVRSKALPTFTNLLHHLAPPISSHEQLRIHITHDLQNYPFVETVVYGVFDRVMQQVEGGDLMVVQRGGGSKPRSSHDGILPFSGGPWWKAMEKRDLNATHGLQEGIKLARASAESYSADHAKAASAETITADNPTRKSNIFLAIQPIIHSSNDGSPETEQVVSFAIHLLDPEHNLNFSTISQALPNQWLEWLDAPPPAGTAPDNWAVPEVIQDIVDAGGVDPREWVVEWVEEAVGLAVGVVAQKYVAKRMRVGEAGEMAKVVRDAEREHAGGEEARAVGM